jgi:hypothetical protein
LPIKKITTIRRKNQRFYECFHEQQTNFQISPKVIPYFIYYAKVRRVEKTGEKGAKKIGETAEMRKIFVFEKKTTQKNAIFLKVRQK